MGKSRSWSCTAGTLPSSRTAGSTPCPTPRRSCWRAWASWPQAPDDIFSKLADADLTFPDAVDGKGEQHPLSNGSYTLLMASEDRALRKIRL